jgi:hypothetical protein
MGFCKGKDGCGVVEATLKGRDGQGSAVLKLGAKRCEEQAHGLGVGRFEDGAHAPPGGALIVQVDRLDQAAMVVGDHAIHAAKSTSFEPGNAVHPRALRFTVDQLPPESRATPLC